MQSLHSIFIVFAFLCGTALSQSPAGGEATSNGDRPANRVRTRGVSPGPGSSGAVPSLKGVQSRIYPLVNVDLTDAKGVSSRLIAFHRISGQNRFVGYLGAAEIEVPYVKIKEAKISTSSEPGGRMRAHFRLDSGKLVDATFDEREGEQLFAGYAEFGRVTIYWRDIRRLTIVARTKTTDLPKYGPATTGVDVRLKDRGGIETELIAFRRATGDNFISGLLGASRVEIPLRIMRKATFHRPADSPLLKCAIDLRGLKPIRLVLKSYEEEKLYRGRAEFGDLRIRLSQVSEITVHRSTPKLRDLDPVAAAEGREIEIDKKSRR
jgi:hypothetical protein